MPLNDEPLGGGHQRRRMPYGWHAPRGASLNAVSIQPDERKQRAPKGITPRSMRPEGSAKLHRAVAERQNGQVVSETPHGGTPLQRTRHGPRARRMA